MGHSAIPSINGSKIHPKLSSKLSVITGKIHGEKGMLLQLAMEKTPFTNDFPSKTFI